jgi:hypothetical protein
MIYANVITGSDSRHIYLKKKKKLWKQKFGNKEKCLKEIIVTLVERMVVPPSVSIEFVLESKYILNIVTQI